MSEHIGGGMYAREIKEIASHIDADEIEVHIWTDRTSAFNPSLVILNLLEVKNLRDYLDRIIKKHPKYFKPRE